MSQENGNKIWVHEKEAALMKEMNDRLPKISFDEALERLGIERYRSRIINSNSHGELFHCHDYIILAAAGLNKERFSEWFDKVVEFAEENWKSPEHVFQHIGRIFMENISPKTKE